MVHGTMTATRTATRFTRISVYLYKLAQFYPQTDPTPKQDS